MLCFTRRLSVSHHGAAASWFGKQTAFDSWLVCAKSLFVFLCLLGVINFVFRGNPMGHCRTENDIVLPFRLRPTEMPVPVSYGFVEDAEK